MIKLYGKNGDIFYCQGNLYLKQEITVARSRNRKHGGSLFELIAIVTDVDDNVFEGSDGIEHM